ncbi:MAG TPA: glycosyltransferase family 4 protein, partial [Bryobacteraceae bacterium]|nr:glycosyltransferase family 4 protein [Bryobacteraceae bacterium]
LRERCRTNRESDEIELLKHYKRKMVQVLEDRYRFAAREAEDDRGKAAMQGLRVLYVANRSAYSGAEETLVRMVESLVRRGVEAHAVVAQSGMYAERLQGAGAVVQVTDSDFADARVTTVRHFDTVLEQVAPEVIHLNGACGQAILLSAARKKIPVIQHLRNSDVDSLGEALHLARAVVSVSEFLASYARQLDIDSTKLRVVYDGIETRHFCPGVFDKGESRIRYRIPADAKVILKIARLAPHKRIDLLLESFALLAERFPEAMLIIVGEPDGDCDYLASVRQQVATMANRGRVRFLDFQSDIRFIECAADVQVSCSENEALGTCILESMSLGVPVVVSDAGGLKEIVENGVSGFVVPAGNAPVLADRIALLLADNALREQMGRSARTVIERNHSIEHCAEEMLRVYLEVVTGRKIPFASVYRGAMSTLSGMG